MAICSSWPSKETLKSIRKDERVGSKGGFSRGAGIWLVLGRPQGSIGTGGKETFHPAKGRRGESPGMLMFRAF